MPFCPCRMMEIVHLASAAPLPAVAAGASIASTRMAEFNPSDPLVGHLDWNMPFCPCRMMEIVHLASAAPLPAVAAGASIASTRMAEFNPSDPLVHPAGSGDPVPGVD